MSKPIDGLPASSPPARPLRGTRCACTSKIESLVSRRHGRWRRKSGHDVARVELAPEVVDDFDRILEYHIQQNVADAAVRIMEIVQAIDVLATNPLIGRPVLNGKRELVIGRKARGYMALYQYVDEIDTVFVLAVRSQREAGYARTSN